MLLPWPTPGLLDGLTAPRRLMLLAHLVQSAADGNLDKVGEYIELAHARLLEQRAAPRDALPIRGAMGRAWAAVGEFSKALETSRAAAQAWIDAGLAGDASYALCEWLRVAGLLGDASEVERANAVAQELLAGFSEDSRAHVHLNRGRALLQVGHAERARQALLDPVFERKAELLAARARWSLRLPGSTNEARAGWNHDLAHARDQDQRVLAALDHALDTGAPVGPIVDTLLELEEPRATLQRLAAGRPLREAAEDLAVLRRLREEVRY